MSLALGPTRTGGILFREQAVYPTGLRGRVLPIRVERTASWSGAKRSLQLSYGSERRGRRLSPPSPGAGGSALHHPLCGNGTVLLPSVIRLSTAGDPGRVILETGGIEPPSEKHPTGLYERSPCPWIQGPTSTTSPLSPLPSRPGARLLGRSPLLIPGGYRVQAELLGRHARFDVQLVVVGV